MGTAVVDARSRRDKGRHGSVNLIVVPHYQKGKEMILCNIRKLTVILL